MKSKNIFLSAALWSITFISYGQDTAIYKLRLSLPLFDLPQTYSLPQKIPSMQQAFELSNDFYELSFWGIDVLGDRIFIPKNKNYTKGKKIGNAVFKYGVSLIFSQYGSELPIPLGVWSHEEYHRSVLGTDNISSKNGNWILNRWEGTVYGISDSTLSLQKSENINNLLYSYVAGVQYEIALNQKTTLNDFYKSRTLNKNALLLYNAYYVFNYFKFSASAISDSVKILAPPHESKNPMERDYAGADLTAWVYDMFNPSEPFSSRDSFPGGNGLNRRIGFSDLSSEEQSYLTKQKNLSLINFINPAIFFINRIKLNNNLSFNVITQYAPTHFGNDVAVFIPLKYKQFDLLLNVHDYSNKTAGGFGVGVGLYNYIISDKWESDLALNFWNQPKAFYDNTKILGGQLNIATKYYFKNNFAGFISLTGKTKGWTISNPYLESNLSVQLGLNYNLKN
ncbi:MAG: hypothetical protein GC181_02110 [Bacteroidetes bacterium]|nr:hypothetical protein [Bacteroidota bacterium]